MDTQAGGALAGGRVTHLFMTVRDLERMLSFYTAVLGFAIVFQNEGECAFLQLPGRSDFTIALYAGRDADGSETPHWFLMIDVDDIEPAVARLRAAGVSVSDIEDVPFGRAAKFADPEGNVLEVHARLKQE